MLIHKKDATTAFAVALYLIMAITIFFIVPTLIEKHNQEVYRRCLEELNNKERIEIQLEQ